METCEDECTFWAFEAPIFSDISISGNMKVSIATCKYGKILLVLCKFFYYCHLIIWTHHTKIFNSLKYIFLYIMAKIILEFETFRVLMIDNKSMKI